MNIELNISLPRGIATTVRTELGKDTRNHVRGEHWTHKDVILHIESEIDNEELLVGQILADLLYTRFMSKGIYGIPQEYIIQAVGEYGFKLLRKNYFIEYAGILGGKDIWIL